MMTETYDIKYSLQRKIMLIFLILGIPLAVCTYGVLRLSVFPAFEDFEIKQSLTNLSRVEQALQSQFQSLETFNLEYAWWDDTYAFVQHPEAYPRYIEEGVLYPELWLQNGVHLIAMSGPDQTLVWGVTVGPFEPSVGPLEDNPLLQSAVLSLFSDAPSGPRAQGLIRTSTDTMLIIRNPIFRNDGSGPMMGYLVTGRYLTKSLVAEISNAASVNAMFYSVSDPDLPEAVRGAIASLSDSATPALTQHSGDNIYTRKLLSDMAGSPAVLIQVSTPKRISAIGADTMSTALVLLSLVIVIFILSTWWQLRWLIVGPIFALKNHITSIRQSGDLSTPFASHQKDEIGALSAEFNELTGELDQTQLQLKDMRDKAVALAKVKSEFLATMSHEIRTPMNGVLGMAELLIGTNLDKRQQIFVQNIQNSGDMLLHVINDILDFSRIESGKLVLESQEIDLRALVEETMDLLAIQAHSKGLELMHSFPLEFSQKFEGDANRLRQILVNIVGNAIKFTNQGEVAVKVTVNGEDSIVKNVFFEIIDTGIGISHEQQGKIFGEFSQADNSLARKYGGTGLGLSISSQLIALMGGEIGLDSEPGKGSCFWFKLPLQSAHEPTPALQSSNALQSVRVLIVDDNQTNREILQNQAFGWGMDYELVSNGPQALSLLRSATAENKPYALVILDWHMPKMDGLEVAQIIRADKAISQLPILMLSSVAMNSEQQEAMTATVDQFLTKPVHQSDLYGCLAKLINNGSKHNKRSQTKRTDSVSISGDEAEFVVIDADVLLVEDNQVNQEVARFMLEKPGCRVELALNGVAALEALNKKHFDLILMDCQMPEMDGFEATQLIRKDEVITQTFTPIVALTANVMDGVRDRCLNAGMNDFLTKPFSQDRLLAILTTWLPKKLIHKLDPPSNSTQFPASAAH